MGFKYTNFNINDLRRMAEQDQPLDRIPLFVRWRGRKATVDSVSDAQQKWLAFRQKTRGTLAQIGDGLDVMDQFGCVIGRINYEGQIW